MTRPATLIKFLGVVLVALVGIAGVTGYGVISLRDRRWTAMEHRVQELRAEMQAPPLPRVPLEREIIPGNAWEDYLITARETEPELAEISLNHLLYGADGGAEAKPLIEKHSRWIELVRRAAHRETCKAPPPHFQDGFTLIEDNTFPPLRTGIALSLAQAHLLEEAGNYKQALEKALDVFLCGRDLAGTRTGCSTGKGIGFMAQALSQMSDVLERGTPDVALLREWERRFALLDEHSLSCTPMLLDNLMCMGEGILNSGGNEVWDSDYARERWRFFFSPRLRAVSYFARADAMVRQALTLEKIPWAQAGPMVEALDQESMTNTSLRFGTAHIQYAQSSRAIRTTLRMNEIAAHFLATGEVRARDSEYGGRIRTHLTQGYLLIWAMAGKVADGPPSLDYFKRYGRFEDNDTLGFAIPVPKTSTLPDPK